MTPEGPHSRRFRIVAGTLGVLFFVVFVALGTWQVLQKNGIDATTLAKLKPVVDQLEQLRANAGEYTVHGVLAQGTWHLHLFKRHLRATVGSGTIAHVKLKCDTRYQQFDFDPKAQYEAAAKDGGCLVELDGTPGTEFELTQF